MGDVIWIFLMMFIVASLAFAPLGYFIYIYSKKNGEPFGDTEPHGDSESTVLKLVENVLNKFKKKTQE